MLMRTKLLSASRRFAAGIDVSPREVRLVIASRKRRGDRPVRVEWIGTAPLAAGALSGVHLVDRASIVAALSSLRRRWPRRHAMRGVPCFMAMPSGATAHASRRHLEARFEVAAAAGIALAAVDSEPLAALRALTHAVEHAPRPDERYAAIWAGYDGIYGWRIADRVVEAAIRFPGGGQPDFESALRLLARAERLDGAVVGGELGQLQRIGLALPDIGERLGCRVAPFGCTPSCCAGSALANDHGDKRAATYAVAFGLALRGVSE